MNNNGVYPMGIENIKAGFCNVSFDGVDLGLTKGGVELKFGVAMQDEPRIGEPEGYAPRLTLVSAEASCPLAELTLQNLTLLFPWCSAVGNTLTIRDGSGEKVRGYAKPLILTAADGGEVITIPLAIPIVTSTWRYVNNSERVTMVLMQALPDLDGNLITIAL